MLQCKKTRDNGVAMARVHFPYMIMIIHYYFCISSWWRRTCCTAILCYIAVLAAGGLVGPPAVAQDSKALTPLVELQDAQRLFARTSDPAALVSLTTVSASKWVRQQAAHALADHYAVQQNWDSYHQVASYASACASLLQALYQGTPKQVVNAVGPALASNPSSTACTKALAAAAAAGFLNDNRVWRQIRVLVNDRQTKLARKLLPLLKDHRASVSQLNIAIQKATRHIRGKHALDTRVSKELLAVAAIVAARRDPRLVGERWDKFAPFIDVDINDQVWPMIGKWASLDHHAAAALAFFRRAPLASHGQFELAWRVRAALRLSDWPEVHTTIAAMQGEQAGLSAWRFWQAYARERTGIGSATGMRQIAADFDDYYGLLAREFSGAELRVGAIVHPPSMSSRLARDADVRLAIALGVAGRTGQARQVWKFLRQSLSDLELLAVAELAADSGWLLGSINAADAAAPRAVNHDLRFPVPYQETVRRYATQFELDPAFVYALMRQESRFNPKAKSRAGARGLMQVMPQTAKAVARKHKYTRYRISRLMLPDTNVIIGTTYITDLRNKFGQDPVLLAAAYNAGPANLGRWLRSSRGIAKLVFVETIPFTETRLYVKSVMANLAHYDLKFQAGIKPWADWLVGRYD